MQKALKQNSHKMEDFSADRTRASAGTRFPPHPPPRLCTLFNSQRFKKRFRHQKASHRIDVFLSVMTRGSGSPFPSLQILCSDQCSSLAAVTQAESLYCPKSSPLYKCMGVEHLCGCQHGLFLHRSYTHIVLLGLGSFGCVHPGGGLVLARTKAQKQIQTPRRELEVQADSACVSAASFRAELGGQLSPYAPSIGCALLDEAALAAAAGRLAELESTVFSSAPTTFWSLPRAWWKLHFQLPCGNFCSAAACPEGHRSALSIASHSSGVELSTRLPKQDFLFVPWKVCKANSGKLKKSYVPPSVLPACF